VIRVWARTRDVPFPCPVCGVLTGKVRGYHGRTAADVPVDGRRVVVRVRVRRLVCPVLGCRRQTFREQVPGLLERLQRRTTRLTSQVSEWSSNPAAGARCGSGGALRLLHARVVPLSSARICRISLTTWGWMLAGEPASWGPVMDPRDMPRAAVAYQAARADAELELAAGCAAGCTPGCSPSHWPAASP
jgi:transposase IS204/IS1001/IS1096/IS1165 family protein